MQILKAKQQSRQALPCFYWSRSAFFSAGPDHRSIGPSHTTRQRLRLRKEPLGTAFQSTTQQSIAPQSLSSVLLRSAVGGGTQTTKPPVDVNKKHHAPPVNTTLFHLLPFATSPDLRLQFLGFQLFSTFPRLFLSSSWVFSPTWVTTSSPSAHGSRLCTPRACVAAHYLRSPYPPFGTGYFPKLA